MNRLLFAAGLCALCATGPAAYAGSVQGPAITTPQQAESEAARRRAEQQRYEEGVREAEAARLRYEAERARYEEARRRHEAEVARANARRAAYDRRMSEREAERAERAEREERRAERRDAEASTAAASADRCEEQQRRSRRRGRAIGGVLGGVAGGLAGRGAGRVAAIALGAPVGALIGDAIARLLDCDEQLQAAAATEEAVRGGVGTTTNWVSESRPNVAGSSTVTALDTTGGDECMTVTDVVIIDGEESRAPKRMCRRPPNNRFVRV